MQAEHELKVIAIENLSPAPDQPREVKDEGEEFDALVESILLGGLLQPLVVRPTGGNKYMVVAGERRLRAARKAGQRSVPCTVMEHLSDEEAFALALEENLLRKALSPVEEGKAFHRLRDQYGTSARDIAKRFGVSHTTVNDRIKLVTLPAGVQADLEEGKRTVTEGTAIAKAGAAGPESGRSSSTRRPGRGRSKAKPDRARMAEAARKVDEARKKDPKLGAVKAKALVTRRTPLGDVVTIADLRTRAEEVLAEAHRRGHVDVRGQAIRITSLKDRVQDKGVDEAQVQASRCGSKPPSTNY